jgi:MATE family multidrug resistance protein
VRRFSLLAGPWIDVAVCRHMIRLGVSFAGFSAAEMSLFIAVTLLMGVIGEAALAANQIVYSIWNVVFIAPVAISQAVTIRVAYGVGLGSQAAVRHSGHVAIAAGALVMALGGVAMWLFPDAIVGLFLDPDVASDVAATELAATLVAIAALFLVFDAVQLIAAGALRGLKDATVPFFVSLLGYWLVGMGGGYALAFPLGLGATGVWWGLAMGLAAAAVILTWRFNSIAARWAPAMAASG